MPMLMLMPLIWNSKRFTVLYLLKLMKWQSRMVKTKAKRFVLETFVQKLQFKVFFYVLKILSNVSMKIGRRTSILTLYANNLSKRIITRCQKVNINFIKGSYINNIYNPSIILY